MSYFSDNYDSLSYPIQTGTKKGLRNAQLGAIHAISSHFTIHDREPAIIIMPTGSGKTGVLFLSAFVLRVRRVLVITPSKLVRNQISEGFGNLSVLIDNGILSKNIKTPKVKEVTEVLDTDAKWNDLSNFDVVVSTPNSLPINSWQVNPPDGLFDLVLIDESHHSPAHTWNSLLKHFTKAKKILFTATPFRRDKKEIKGSFIYNYPISKAFEDNIFGPIDFIAVKEYAGRSNDISLAGEAQRVFDADKKKGFKHYLLIRTDTKTHSKELLEVYSKNTTLRLKRIDSTFSSKQVNGIISQLLKEELDGIICVDMLGEGFDFPHLKIGVIHHPHKSLAVTLQFIGRFARTNAANIGSAKFLAIPNEIEFLKLELYQEGAVWKDIIVEISENTIASELNVRKTLKEFVSQPVEFEDERDISLYSLKPFHHVKIYEVPRSINILKQIIIPDNNIDKHFVSEELSVAVYITKEIQKPKWLSTDELINVNFNLFIIYYDSNSQLLYINSTRKTLDTYKQIAEQYLDGIPKQLPLELIYKVIADLSNPEVFNLGLRSKNTINNAESYLIKAGSHVQNAIKSNEINLYEGGHMFLRGQEGGSYKTIGYSSSSKVWSNATSTIVDFIKWCSALSIKILNTKEVVTNTDLDKISMRKVVAAIPGDVIFAFWDAHRFRNHY
ncbi:DEAD/DEAH box helicase [Mucilaginibacter sp. HD30]